VAVCERLKPLPVADAIKTKTGLLVDPYFSGTKLMWLYENVASVQQAIDKGEAFFGTIDTWLVWKLTGGKVHATDITNASRTMLFNIHTCQWDEELLTLLEVPASLLPQVRSSSEVFGQTESQILAAQIPIAGIAGDQQAALFGQMCTEPGMVKNTYGTGCFMLMNIGDKPILSKNNLVTTIAWQIDGKVQHRKVLLGLQNVWRSSRHAVFPLYPGGPLFHGITARATITVTRNRSRRENFMGSSLPASHVDSR